MSFISKEVVATFVFIIFITIVLCTTCTKVSPFYYDTIFPRYSNFEGFAPKADYVDYSTKEHLPLDNYNRFLITPKTECNKPECNKPEHNKQDAVCDKIFGFNGLLCHKQEVDAKLDMFSDAPGKLECANGFGLSNSKGSLCLTETHINLLRSRGGNNTGGDSLS